MPLTKNQILRLSIESLSSDGNGVAHWEGQAHFCSQHRPPGRGGGPHRQAMKGYAFGRLEKLLVPGPGRIEPDCPAAGPCGGCGLRHMAYAAECQAQNAVRAGRFRPAGPAGCPCAAGDRGARHERYRNKVQLPVGRDADGHLVTGFYAGRSHRIVACADCKLQPVWMNELAARACALLEQARRLRLRGEPHTGLVRHLYMRQGWHSGQRLLCFVINGHFPAPRTGDLPHAAGGIWPDYRTHQREHRPHQRGLGPAHPHGTGARVPGGYAGRGIPAHGRA